VVRAARRSAFVSLLGGRACNENYGYRQSKNDVFKSYFVTLIKTHVFYRSSFFKIPLIFAQKQPFPYYASSSPEQIMLNPPSPALRPSGKGNNLEKMVKFPPSFRQ